MAHAILSCAVRPRRELVVGGGGVPLIALRRMAPHLYDRIGPAITFFERRGIPARNPPGALHAPQPGGHQRGDQPGYVMRTSLYTRAMTMGSLVPVVVAGAAVALVAAIARRR